MLNLSMLSLGLDLDSAILVQHPILSTYALLKGNASYVSQLVAVLGGVKRAMDDWVPAARAPDLAGFLRSLGLCVAIDTVFHPFELPAASDHIKGATALNTTIALGEPWTPKATQGLAHIFIAKDNAQLEEAVAYGWYPLVWRDVVLHKPWIDHPSFGLALGYPECCVDQFARANDWKRTASYYESLRQSLGSASALTNCFAKHTALSYINHIPCSFTCSKTMLYAQETRRLMLELDPKLVRIIDEFLRQRFLHIAEDEIYWLMNSGAFPGESSYTGFRWIPANKRPDPALLSLLATSDSVAVTDQGVIFSYQQEVVGTYNPDYAPSKRPFLITFA
jgi:hypothetical protein